MDRTVTNDRRDMKIGGGAMFFCGLLFLGGMIWAFIEYAKVYDPGSDDEHTGIMPYILTGVGSLLGLFCVIVGLLCLLPCFQESKEEWYEVCCDDEDSSCSAY